jgi:hypothetical protein
MTYQSPALDHCRRAPVGLKGNQTIALTSLLPGKFIMEARPRLFTIVSICVLSIAAQIPAGADETSVKVAIMATWPQTSMPQGSPHGLQLAQQCRSGHDDCMTRPQEQCGPGLNDCLSQGQANCKDSAGGGSPGGGVNTAGLDNALKNPNLTPEQRANLERNKAAVEAANQRRQRAGAAEASFAHARCLQDVVNQCRANHC